MSIILFAEAAQRTARNRRASASGAQAGTAAPAARSAAEIPGGGAEILFFTGIRIERHAEEPPPAMAAPASAPRRRRLPACPSRKA